MSKSIEKELKKLIKPLSKKGEDHSMSHLEQSLEGIDKLKGTQKIKRLEGLILKYKHLYYAGQKTIPDEVYDELENQLQSLEPSSPVLQMVGATVKTGKVAHDTKMLSLGKTYKMEELENWVDKHDVISTYKYDGSSCSILYKNGLLHLGKTRGDGSFGENITTKITWIDDIPKMLSVEEDLEVRGELYCKEEDFLQLSREMEKLGLEKPNSLRNIVAGILSRKDYAELARFISFSAFDCIRETNFKTELDKLKFLQKENFIVPDFFHHIKKATLKESIDDAKDFMGNGNFLIDGLVFTYNDINLHEELGSTAHHPRFKMAFKFQGMAADTKIKEIIWSVSRNGILTPVADVEPIELSGAKISRVTLHNYGMVNEFQLKKDVIIKIVRSGEVIPKFLEVVKQSKQEFSIPSQCPSCGEKVFVEDIRLICRNSHCPDQIKEGILNFIQKIGIDDLSSKRLEEMIRKGLVMEIPDLYKLSMKDMLTLDKVKDKLATKILENINKSKNVDLITFLGSLGITGGAFNKCEKIVSSGYSSIDKVLSLTMEQLIEVDSFAEKSASDFLSSLKEKNKVIKNLLKLGFEFKEDSTEGPLKDLKICITGALSEKRSVVEKSIRDAGGTVVGSVSKNTDYLLTNETDSKSSKFKKANQLGIKIVTEEEMKKITSS
ncbi:MAG: NAD-dependent DNA ligase LigA [Bacteriovoracaceae bacterium]